MDALAAHESDLARRLWRGLDVTDRVTQLRMWDDAGDRVGVAAFTVEGWEAHHLGAHLAEHGIAVRAGSFCAHPLVAHLIGVPTEHTNALLHEIECGGDVSIPGAVRASIGLGTTAADIDLFLEAVADCARS
jgi:selenocysteine lyase/cysteine desulfurase